MMGNFFNRMYYGKGGKGDYTKDDLPDNRWQLFIAMLRLNFTKLIQLNLMFAVFFVPTLIWTYINLQAFMLVEAEEMLSYFTMYIYGLAPCLIILSPAVTAATYITRNMARDQNVWIWSDFWYAIKQNWKPMLGLAFINALALIVGYTALMFYRAMAAQGTIYMLISYFMTVLIVVYIAMNYYMWPMMVTYELSVRQVIKNSFVMAVGRLPHSLFMLVVTIAPPFLVFFVSSNAIVMLAGLALYLLIGFAVTGMAVNSVTNGIFDKFINVRIKGARVNQGLRIEYDGDDEQDDGDDEQDDGDERDA